MTTAYNFREKICSFSNFLYVLPLKSLNAFCGFHIVQERGKWCCTYILYQYINSSLELLKLGHFLPMQNVQMLLPVQEGTWLPKVNNKAESFHFFRGDKQSPKWYLCFSFVIFRGNKTSWQKKGSAPWNKAVSASKAEYSPYLLLKPGCMWSGMQMRTSAVVLE